MNDGYIPVEDAAEVLGVDKRTIYFRIKGGAAGKWPPLGSRMIAGKRCVLVPETYQHFCTHGRRPAGLRAPVAAVSVDQDAPTADGYKVDPEIKSALGGVDPNSLDADELAYRLAVGGVSPDKVRVLVQSVRAMQNKRSIDLRAGKSFTPDEVVEMLRSYGETFVEEIDGGAPAFATHLLNWIGREFGVVLGEKNPAAAQLVENQVRESFGNAILAKLRKQIDSEVQGVRALEFQK